MGMKTFTVLRQHEGDRLYLEGEAREAEAGEVQHLVDMGVLGEAVPAQKAERAPLNKAERRAPLNKAEA